MALTSPLLVDYGRDLSCITRTQALPFPDGSIRDVTAIDLDVSMTETSGRALLAEAVARRLVTFRGTLVDDPTYGFDVREYLNSDLSPRELAAIGAGIDNELTKEERLLRSQTVVTFLAGVLLIAVNLVDLAGPFRLTLAVTDVSVTVLQVQP